jgi:hypothetical protein
MNLILLTLLKVDAKRSGKFLGEAGTVGAAIYKCPDGEHGPILTLKKNLYCWMESRAVP